MPNVILVTGGTGALTPSSTVSSLQTELRFVLIYRFGRFRHSTHYRSRGSRIKIW